MFDYGCLNGTGDLARATAKTIKESLASISNVEAVAMRHRKTVGTELLKMRVKLTLKQFKSWISEEFGFSLRTSQVYIALVVVPGADAAPNAAGMGDKPKAKPRKKPESSETSATEDKDDHPSNPTGTTTNRCKSAIDAMEAQATTVPPALSDKQKIAQIMELVASLESPDSQYEVVAQTVAMLHKDDRSELFAKLNAKYKEGEEKQAELFCGDPADLVPPKKINTPEVRKAWARWCDSNKSKGKPLTVEEGRSQLHALSSGKAETAVSRIEHALAMRMDHLPLAKDVPNDFEHPTEDQVLGYATAMKIPEATARDFFSQYSRQGWVLGNGQMMADWKQSLHHWNKKQVAARGGKQDGAMFVQGTESESGQW